MNRSGTMSKREVDLEQYFTTPAIAGSCVELVKKHYDLTKFDNIFACGGAACGVSGPDVSGYLSGNGLLTALSLGEIAGRSAGMITSISD